MKVKGLKYAICFDVMGEQGDMYQLINDRYSGSSLTLENGLVKLFRQIS